MKCTWGSSNCFHLQEGLSSKVALIKHTTHACDLLEQKFQQQITEAITAASVF